MEGIHLLRDVLQPNDWLGKIDLKDAYFVVPIWEKHQKFLRFVWKDSLMEFACVPFGLASAPRVFTKLNNLALQEPFSRAFKIECIRYTKEWVVVFFGSANCLLSNSLTIWGKSLSSV